MFNLADSLFQVRERSVAALNAAVVEAGKRAEG